MSEFLIHVAAVSCLYGILALALNLQMGFSGLVNFGLIALFGCGTYGAAFAHLWGWPPLAGLALGLIFAALMGLFFARLGARMSEDYWGIATLSLAEIMRLVFTNEQALAGGAQGVSGLPVSFAGLAGQGAGLSRLALYAALLAAAFVLCQRITRSGFGMALKMMREEPQLARALGYDLGRMRAIVMVISSLMAAVAGFLYAHYLSFVGPEQLMSHETFLIWSMVIIGGIANNWGVVAGAFLMQFALAYVPFVKDWLDMPSDFVAATRLVIVGGGILAFLIWRPKGLFPERIGGSHG
ncbi:branched-chain amino acid ABC transporter permease [Alloyangia pacifica]|uniref:Branched-chain amino acid transport system permease protein n=1 Tax=Alloyangia pacifica TaxID=311180 RepID=A0A1I6VXC7_9RHOB|nr:branched-chain amino acid ABC transporter permease [Alloyangia pacifica]SDI20428.1 branched-chain amino acid transport system permease protein [Alloyangia pacifica]SFT18378.1 branched-chain amino acid transport system permease protein [Alloyangia pacifica]